MGRAGTKLMQGAAFALAILGAGAPAQAQSYPTRPITAIIPFAGGSASDVVSRIMFERMSRSMGRRIIVENRPGAGGNTGTAAAAKAAPDGYTLLEASTSNAWNAMLYQNLKFDFIRDIAPVASSVKTYNVLIVNPAFPPRAIPELIAYAKANPGKINMGSAGPGSSPHLYGELFKAMTGVDMVTVHYRGDGPAVPELIAGRIQVMFGSVVTWVEQIKAGTVRALAVTSATRTQLLPDLPPVGEFVPGYEGIGWQGIGAPRGTPAGIVDELNGAINAGLADPKFKSRFDELGAETFAGSPVDFGKFIIEYTEKWAKIIRGAGVKGE